MTNIPVCYTCVTNGYDVVAPVSRHWRTQFIMFHDGSVTVPDGWDGATLSPPGVTGVDLNRYAKMLPHRLGLPSEHSLYVDGNIFFRDDPFRRISDVLALHKMAAMTHPNYDCAYSDIARTLRLGFVWPGAARRAVKLLRECGVPKNAGLFECNLLFRQHNDTNVIALGEAWWKAWQLGYRRDQALMIAAAFRTGVMPASLGRNDIRDQTNAVMGITPHLAARSRGERLPRRIASEALFYRRWTCP